MYEEGIELLLGKTIKAIDIYETDKGDEVYFICDDESVYEMYHERDCCEYVCLEDATGNWNDLLDNPILLAEESAETDDDYNEEETLWTFYKLATIKGYVDLRWCGSSDYYSLEVEVVELSDTFAYEHILKRGKRKGSRTTYTNDEKYIIKEEIQ